MLILCAGALLVAIDNAVDYSWCILIKIFNNIEFTTKFNYLWSQILLVNLYLELNLKSKNRVNYKFGLLEKWLPWAGGSVLRISDNELVTADMPSLNLTKKLSSMKIYDEI